MTTEEPSKPTGKGVLEKCKEIQTRKGRRKKWDEGKNRGKDEK